MTRSTIIILAALLLVPLASRARTPSRSVWRAAPEGTLEVLQLTLTRKITDRKPAGEVSRVTADGKRIYGYINVFNKGPERRVTMVWSRNGRAVHRYQLEVGRSPGWRTWSFLTARHSMRGEWTVQVQDETGRPLAEQAITIEGPPRLARK